MEWLMSLWHKRHSLSQPIKEYDRIVDGPEARKRVTRRIVSWDWRQSIS
jgi:hypothetical protein